jgi:hypothetical protein
MFNGMRLRLAIGKWGLEKGKRGMDPTQPNVLLTKEKVLMAKSWTTYYSHIVKIELTNYTLFCQKKRQAYIIY